MNHQEPRGQDNRNNANIQTQVSRHLSSEALQRLRHSSSSFSAESDQRFPYRLSGSIINLPPENNGRSAGVLLHEPSGSLGLSVSYSSSLTRSSLRFPNRLYGSSVLHHQGTIGSVPQNNINPSAENVEDINLDLSLGLPLNPTGSQNQSGNTSYVNEINNRTNGSTSTTMGLPSMKRPIDRELLAGESSSMGEARMAKRQATGVASDVFANDNMNTSLMHIGPINNHPRGFQSPISHRPAISAEMHGAHNESFRNNINMQIIAATTAQASVHTNRFSDGYTRGVQAPLHSHAPLFSQMDSPVLYSSSERAHAPNFGRVQRGSHIGNGHRAGNFLGNLPNNLELNGFFTGNLNISNATAMVSQQERPVQIVSASMGNLSARQGIVLFGQSSRGGPSSASGMDPTIPISNLTPGNRLSSVATPEIQAGGGNAEQPPHPLRPLAHRDHERRAMLGPRVQTAMEHLRNGGTIRIEDLMSIDYSVVVHMIEVQNEGQNEALVAAARQDENPDQPGLSEEVIMKNIRHENFELVSEETPENKEACCICQEEYVNGEEIGRVDCGHIFHIDCIKQWLVQKNVCPICRRKALLLIDEEDEND